MALMNDGKVDKRSKEYKATQAASQEANAESTPTNQSSDQKDTLLVEMQAQMRAMQDKIKVLETPKTNMREEAKKIYSGPREYSYKTWNDIPVCSYVSKKIDPTKSLVDKNKHGQYESNHIVVLTLANGETIDVDIDVFGANFGRSEKMPAKVVTDPYDVTKVIGYEFSTAEYPSFIVVPGLIN